MQMWSWRLCYILKMVCRQQHVDTLCTLQGLLARKQHAASAVPA
jgi:hypothetical protein